MNFEVICPDCGDDGGPFDEQPTEVRALRGPYPDAAAAGRIAQEHRAETGVRLPPLRSR